MNKQHPSTYASDLQQERLVKLCNEILNVVEDALLTASTDNDTPWTRGTLVYGRVQGFCQNLYKSQNMPWAKLVNSTMDFTLQIGSTYIQFVMDDPFAPKKAHRLKANNVEQMNLGLNTALEVVTWRLFVDKYTENDMDGIKAYLVGFDCNQNTVCIWNHEQTIPVPIQTTEKPAEVIIEDPQLQRRNSKTKSLDKK